jgi:hypothetical protein
MISFACASCSQEYQVSNDKVGKRTACKVCSNPLVVPEPEKLVEPEQDWELVSESEEMEAAVEAKSPDANPSASAEPTCPQCQSHAFAFTAIYGPTSFVAKLDGGMARAAEALQRSLGEARAEAERRSAAIDEWETIKKASVQVQAGDVAAVSARAESQRGAIRTWLVEQEGVAQRAHEDAVRRLKAENPVQSKNRLYLVYCTSCGHIVTATPGAGNLQEGLVEVKKAVNRLHNTVLTDLQARARAAKAQQQSRAVQAGLQAVNALFNSEQ